MIKRGPPVRYPSGYPSRYPVNSPRRYPLTQPINHFPDKKPEKKQEKTTLSTSTKILVAFSLLLLSALVVFLIVKGLSNENDKDDEDNLNKFNADLKISHAQLLNYSDINVNVNKPNEEDNVEAIIFIFYDNNTEVTRRKVSILSLEEVNFQVVFHFANASRIDKISIIPVFKSSSGEEVTGEVEDQYVVESNNQSVIEEPEFNDTLICKYNSQCDDLNNCTRDICSKGNCSNTEIPNCVSCQEISQCEDLNACTTNKCLNGVCAYLAIPNCVQCYSSQQCDDNKLCTEDICFNDRCIHNPLTNCTNVINNTNNTLQCTTQNQIINCNDNNVCTSDTCVNNKCVNTPLSNCISCSSSTECNDYNSCTKDTCSTNKCIFTNVTSCVTGDKCCPKGCTYSNDGDCLPVCGNNIKEGTEKCDGNSLGGATCAGVLGTGYTGTLKCSNCMFNTSLCVAPCTQTCQSLGYTCGTRIICGVKVDCGNCSFGYSCNVNGTCINRCTDSCSSSGLKECASSTSFRTCGNYDSDSCLEWGGLTSCGSGQACSNGVCSTSCISHASSACYSNTGDVYWYDSCGVREEIRYDCTSSQTCSNGQCVNSGTTNPTIEQADYYVATNGNDNNPGTIDRPFATWQKAFDVAQAGDLVYIRGGTYYPSTGKSGGGAYSGVFVNYKSGSSGSPIRIFAYPGETPVLDCRNIAQEGERICLYLYNSNYWYLKGLSITRADQTTTGQYGANGIRIYSGNYNKLEGIKSYSNGGSGITIIYASEGNEIINCDAYDNYDRYTLGYKGGHADGIEIADIFERNGNERVNKISGSRAWHNSDDGFDFYNCEGYLFLNNCWSWDNGYDNGDGSGFKLGIADGTAESDYQRVLTNCISTNNLRVGYDQIDIAHLKIKIYNSISYNEEAGFSFYTDNNADIIRNCISYKNSYNNWQSNQIRDHNSWDTSGITVTDGDFVSLDKSQLSRPRKPDGSLPDITFAHLAPGSDLIDKGVSVSERITDGDGKSITGTPDLGPFEYSSSSSTPSCTTHSYSACYSNTGDVYWYDSCGVREEIRYDCTSTQTCSNGQCVNSNTGTTTYCGDKICNGVETCSSCSGDCGSCPSYSRTFYVSSSSGDDGNTGLSESSPWKTLSKVNSYTFRAGDAILFKRGDIWYGSLVVTSSGSSSAPITYGAYGSGEKPIITGFTTISGWTNEGNGIYSRTVSSQSNPNILSFNGKNTPIGRWPNTGWLIVDSHDGFNSITDNDLSTSPKDWDGGELVLRAHWWIILRNKITSHSGNTIYYNSVSDYYPAMDGNGYFIQNHIGALDTLGEWAYDGSKLYVYFGSNSPNNYVVKFPSIDNFAYLNNRDYISFDNLHITGYNNIGITIYSSTYTKVTNCLFDFIGNTGIDSPWQQYSDHPVIEHNTFEEINNDGISLKGDSQYSSVQYNTFKNIGSIPGLSGSEDGCAIGIFLEADNSVIKYNTIKNIGYNGITFGGANTLVSNNFLDTFCMNKDDCGGIYTYQDEDSGKQITNNIIINGIGDEKSTRLPNEGRAHGIYIDGSDNVLISGNSVAYVHGAGIFLNTQARNMDVFNNNVFDTFEAGIMIISNMNGGGEITDLEMQNNIFVAKDSDEETVYYATTSGDSAIRSLGTVNNNYYARPIDDTNTMRTQTYAWNGPSVYRTLSGWQSYTGLDGNSKKSPKSVSSTSDLRFEYNPTSSSKTVSLDRNYIDVKGTSYSGSLTLPPYSSILLIKN